MSRPWIEVALACTRRGWHVFPVAPGAKLPVIPAAHPAGSGERRSCRGGCGRWGHGVHDATINADAIARWWQRWPTANVGIACGPSQLVVVDLDVPKPSSAGPGVQAARGADTLAALATQAGAEVPFTYVARTGSGGLHLYFRAPTGLRLPNTAGRLGRCIDTRADGGYVLAATSVVAGRRYDLLHDTEPVELPGWLLERLLPRVAAARTGGPMLGRGGYAHAALRGEVQRVLAAEPGCRNATLNRAAYSLGTLVGAGVLAHDLAEEALHRAGEGIGLMPREVTATVTSGLRAGTAQPRTARPQGGGTA